MHVLAHEATRSVCFWISCAVGEPVLQFLVPDSVLASAVSVPSSVWVFQRFKPAEISLYTVVVHFTCAPQFNPKLHVSTLRPYLVVSRLEGWLYLDWRGLGGLNIVLNRKRFNSLNLSLTKQTLRP